jgi:Lysyl oxidase
VEARFLAAALVSIVLAAAAGAGRRDLLPDLDQRLPDTVSIVVKGGHRLLTFGSATDNRGEGPLIVVGRRDGPIMTVTQIIDRSDGSSYSRPTGAVMRYVRTATHEHWHLIGFERYDLYRASDHTLVGRSRKVGFCLGDRYLVPGSDPNLLPVYTSECGKNRPDLQRLRAGISPNFGDDYVPQKEGQYVDVSGLPAGRYELVHVANPGGNILESDYGNNAASVLVQLPSGKVLATCPDTDTCPG